MEYTKEEAEHALREKQREKELAEKGIEYWEKYLADLENR